MISLSRGLSYVDVRFRNLPRVVAAAVVHDKSVAIVDPGPSSTLPTLDASLSQAGISMDDVSAVLLTHIHLDHAGCTGTLVARNRRIKVYVHEIGAPHLVNPEKIVSSLRRLAGDDLERVWGAFPAVPADAIRPLTGGEVVEEAGRRFEVAYTPGHASHHVSYFDRSSGIAFVGDVGAMRLVPDGYVLPPTPPPDIDLPLWRESLARIEQWAPETLFLTHFGPVAPVGAHVATVRDNLEFAARLAQQALERPGSEEERERWFVEQIHRELRRHMTDTEALGYEAGGRPDWNYRGLARYLTRKR